MSLINFQYQSHFEPVYPDPTLWMDWLPVFPDPVFQESWQDFWTLFPSNPDDFPVIVVPDLPLVMDFPVFEQYGPVDLVQLIITEPTLWTTSVGSFFSEVVEHRQIFRRVILNWRIGDTETSLLRQIFSSLAGPLYRIVHESEDTLTGFAFKILDRNNVDVLEGLGTGSGSYPRSIWPATDGNILLRLPTPGDHLHLSITTTGSGETGTTYLYFLR